MSEFTIIVADRLRRGMTGTLRRYILFQIPGWVLFGIAMALAHRWNWLSARAALLLSAAWILKDALMYPFFGFAYAPEPRTPTERLVGARGVAVKTLSPRGYVKVRGELWQAEAASPATIHEGQTVVVCEASGMTLVVRAEEGARPEGSSR